MSGALPLLWQYSFSNYNEKVRWALDFKGIRHRRQSLLLGGPRAMSFSRRGGTLPVLDLDGRRIVDSTAIIAALEERYPEPALYPADAEERRRALELEDYFDEHAGHDMRRVGFWEARNDRGYAEAFVAVEQGSAARLLLKAGWPLGWAYARRRYDFTEEAVERSRGALLTALERIESEREGRDHLVGDAFTVADLTAAALLYPLVFPPEYQYELPGPPPSEFLESVQEHPAVGWIRETWRRHRGTSAGVG